jgi:hypothetical protein
VTQRLHHDEIDIGAKATGRQRTLQEIATVAYLSSHNLWEPALARSGLQDNMRGARRLWALAGRGSGQLFDRWLHGSLCELPDLGSPGCQPG